jgi:hypothetical protein
LPHHSSASRFTVGGAEQRDEREHIQPQQEARYGADAWEDKIHDILLDKSRVTVGQVAIDGLAFETPAPPAFVDMPFEIYDVRKVGTVRDGLLFQQGKSSRAGASPINPYKCRQSLAARSHEGALRMFT